jgi:hypothetical protein
MAFGTSLTVLFAFFYFLCKKYITESWRWKEETILNLGWQLALTFFLCLIVARLILAPYRKYRELEKHSRWQIRRRRDKWQRVARRLRTERNTSNSQLAEAVEQVKNTRSEFHGELLDFVMWPYASPQAAAEAEAKEDADPYPPMQEPITPDGSSLIVKVYFVNVRPAGTTIRNFSLRVKDGDEIYEARYAEEGEIPRYNPKLKKSEPLYNLEALTTNSEECVMGKGKEGFLRFNVVGITPEQASDEITLAVTITDAFGIRHNIARWGALPKPSRRIELRAPNQFRT